MTLHDLTVIPTGMKSKIPHTLSFPVGAEILSRAFAGVPQFSELSVDFWFWPRVQRDWSTYPVAEIAYRRSAKSIHTRDQDLEGQLKRHWEIRVWPVPRARRHVVKMQLEEALPSVRAWLLKNADRCEVGHSALTLSFDEEKQELTATESSSLEPRRSA